MDSSSSKLQWSTSGAPAQLICQLFKLFNESALAITKQPKWVAPSPHWDVESLISDLNSLTTKVGRKEYLAEFIENVDEIFANNLVEKAKEVLNSL